MKQRTVTNTTVRRERNIHGNSLFSSDISATKCNIPDRQSVCCPVLSVVIYFMLAWQLHYWKHWGKESQKQGNSHMQDVLKVNVADLETVTDFDFFQGAYFFLLFHSTTDIFWGVAKIETSSWRIKAPRKHPEIHRVQTARHVIQMGICQLKIPDRKVLRSIRLYRWHLLSNESLQISHQIKCPALACASWGRHSHSFNLVFVQFHSNFETFHLRAICSSHSLHPTDQPRRSSCHETWWHYKKHYRLETGVDVLCHLLCLFAVTEGFFFYFPKTFPIFKGDDRDWNQSWKCICQEVFFAILYHSRSWSLKFPLFVTPLWNLLQLLNLQNTKLTPCTIAEVKSRG